MQCGYCIRLEEGKTYRVDGDGFCVKCHEKIYSDGVNVVYVGVLRSFHRFKTEAMSVCGNCGVDLSEMTLPCFDCTPQFYHPIELIEVTIGE